MIKRITALTAAGAIAIAALVSVPNKAEAYPAWVIPVVAMGVVGGIFIATGVANAHGYTSQPRGAVYVQPRAATNCSIVRERTASGKWRRVEVCH